MSRALVFATFLAPNLKPVYEAVVEKVSLELGVAARLVVGDSLEQLDDGTVDFAFVCGLPYVRMSDRLTPIAAPVVEGERYQGLPIYFSDVIVNASSPARSIADLRGCSWAYNEPDSHSGYLVTLFKLHEMGESRSFFSGWEMAGFHQESIRRVAAGRVDGSAIDSQVLAVELRDHPGLRSRIRVIDVLGPSTIQPLVATAGVDPALAQGVQAVVTGMHGEALRRGLIERFVAIDDSRYDDIRRMLREVDAGGMLALQPA